MTLTATRSIPFARPWIDDDDRQAVLEVLKGHVLTHGPQCKQFEAEFASLLGPGAHAVTVSSCMAALHLACLHFGFKPGDEVLVPAQTHTATVHAVEWVGAKPVFLDCDPQTGNVTPQAVAAAVTKRTRGLILVHFVGGPADMAGIMKVAAKHDLTVIEDCAIALGARIKGAHVGLFGDAATFSFYPVKHVTTGEGGMFVSKHEAVAEAVARLRAFGVDRSHAERAIPGMYDVPSLGLNYRMSEMSAALGRAQLRRFDENLKRRARHFEALKGALASVPETRVLDSRDASSQNSHYCLSLLLEGRKAARRDAYAAAINAAGIGTSIYYPQPVPRLAYYRGKYGYDAKRWPNAIAISDGSIALPVGPHLGADDIAYLTEQLPRILETKP